MRRFAKHRPNGRLSPEEIRELQRKVRRRDQEKCVVCLNRRGVAVHEIVPRSSGQTRSPEIFNEHNMVCLCRECHDRWHFKNASGFRALAMRHIARHMRQFYPDWQVPDRPGLEVGEG